ncbi:MAG TPA: hypothetical protein VMV27_07595 [Candidatus Binataceae bacterium]|nr:hypothetical protein [Candidatus Binataceae bacterium]
MIEIVKRGIERHFERRRRQARYGALCADLRWALGNLNAAIATAAMLQARPEDRALCVEMQNKAAAVRDDLEAVIGHFERATAGTPCLALTEAVE